MSYLNLIRWKNLLLLIIAQVLVKYALLEPFNVTTRLSNFEFLVLVFATLCIAAAGNIINDIYDVQTDSINKPKQLIIGKHISENQAYNLFFTLTIIGVSLGFYLSYRIGNLSFFGIFAMISMALYVYASYLKGTIIFGNILISLLVAMSIIIVGVFDVLPVISYANRDTQLTFFDIILDYAFFAFLINLIRELIKDIQDVDGDYKAGMNTLPIAIGRERANKIAFIVSMIPIGVIIYFLVTYLYKQPIAIGYFLILIIAPLLYATIKIFGASNTFDYKHISTIYKVVMLLGVLSLLLYPLLIKTV